MTLADSPEPTSDAAAALAAIRRDLKAQFIERDTVIDGALLAILSRQHVLMLGPPGTAKSMIARQVCLRIAGQRYFEWLLTKFTTPEEIFGPISLPALEQGRYERIITDKLPEAEIGFLDEVFKANSAILNALLTVLNERRFHQGSRILEVPVISLFAASNELPDEDELGALYDRFLLRFRVGYIEHDDAFTKLLKLSEPQRPDSVLSADHLSQLQLRVGDVRIPDPVLADLVEIRNRLQAQGIVASDRRYRQSLSVVRASAVLDGRSEANPADLRWLEHVLWTDPEEQEGVAKVLSALATGFEEEARTLLSHAKEVIAYARRPWPDSGAQSRAVLEAHAKLEEIKTKLDQMRTTGAERGRDTTVLDGLISQLVRLFGELLPGQN